MALRLANATRAAYLAAFAARVDAGPAGGTIKVYTGSMPATSDTAATGTLLLTFTLSATAFEAAASNVMPVADLPIPASGAANGTAGWARLADSTGAPVADGTAGTSGSNDLQLTTAAISTGLTVNLVGGTISQPA